MRCSLKTKEKTIINASMSNLWIGIIGYGCQLYIGRGEKEGRQGEIHHTGRVARGRVILLSHFLSVATVSQWQSLHHFRKLESQHPHLETRIPAAEGGTDGNNEAVRVTAINQLFPYGLEHFTVFPPERQRKFSEPHLTSVLQVIDMCIGGGAMGVL